MLYKAVNLKDIPVKGRRSGKFGERDEMILSVIDKFMSAIQQTPDFIIEIVDDDHVFNNNNDLRRTYQIRIKEYGLQNQITIIMRKGRVFLISNDMLKELMLRDGEK